MNLLYDFQIFSMQRYGGVSRYFYEIISGLIKKNDIEISLFLGDFINEYGLEKYHDMYSKFRGRKYRGSEKLKRLLFLNNELRFRPFCRKLEADIYHPTYYRYYDYVKRKKYIITIHDLTHELYPSSFKYPKLVPNLRSKQIKKADGIICVSNATKADLLKYYDVDEDKVKVIYHANSLSLPQNTAPLFEKPYILFVGGRSGYKNFKILLEIFKNDSSLNSNYLLVCYGGGSFSKDELNSFGTHSDSIKWMAGDDDILANLFRNASVFVYPSLNEGFGIPVLEAMSLGCPVLAADKSSLPEVGADAAMYFDPDSDEDLKEKLELILNSNDVRNDLLSKGKERNNLFTWEKCVSDTLRFYEMILSR
jgi:glycosyltransferase involved in cell wall biosynthesis